MLTNLAIGNFKRFDRVEIELASPVVLIGPNNSGKTSAMQALALWNLGLKRWNEKHGGVTGPQKRPGVTVNRRDLVAVPTPTAKLLWHELRTRQTSKVDGQQTISNVCIEIVVDGVGASGKWTCGLELDYANPESFYCRPLKTGDCVPPDRMPIPTEALSVEVAFLPPMSGLAATETRLDHGAVNVRVGEGRTAEVLRNLCWYIHEDHHEQWTQLTEDIDQLFGARLDPPRYLRERGEITMSYTENNVTLDLSSSGRGLQQTLLIFAYMYANPGTVLLLDEPDAHLEILRQRQIYQRITEAAAATSSQIIVASHSEVLLNEAAGRDMVIAFVGAPHRIDDRGSQVLKALKEIGFDHYALAEQTGWVLYLEGSTDLAILHAFARLLERDDVQHALEQVFVHYVGDNLAKAKRHYYGLREALPELSGIVLLDSLGGDPSGGDLQCLEWQQREIENYLCTRATLEEYASASARSHTETHTGPLFIEAEVNRRLKAMRGSIDEIENAMKALGRGSPWDTEAKVSDDFLSPLFIRYFEKLSQPNLLRKTNFHTLVQHMPRNEISPEVIKKLDAIMHTAKAAGAG